MSEESWCVVGGGMLGMALANRLAKPGRKITILEAGPNFGGLADAWSIGDYTWDRHYHVTLLSDANLRGLLDEIGLGADMRWTVTKTDFYTDRQFYPLNNAVDYLKFPPIGLIGKFRLGMTIIYASMIRNGVRLEKIPVGEWLTKLSGKKVYERIWKPLLQAKLGENHKIASASFIWSVINRFYGARRSGLKTEMFGYVEGGYRRVIERLVSHLQAKNITCRASTPVSRIEKAKSGLNVITPKGNEHFDRVIVTAPGPIAARMCVSLTKTEHDRLSALRYQGVVCCSALIKRPLRGRYLTYIADEKVPLTGIIEMTAVVDKQVFGGNSLIYLPQYVPADDPLFEASDDDMRARAMDALRYMYEDFSEDDVIAFRVSRARNVMAVQGLEYSKAAPPMATSVEGLDLVNSAQIINGNLNVDETIALANRAADLMNSTNPLIQAYAPTLPLAAE